MVSKLIEKFDGELNRLSVKHSITRKQIEVVLEHFFEDLKSMITDPRMPKVTISNLGTFYPSLSQINKTLYKSFFWRKMGNKNDESLRRILRKLWPIRRRLQKEKRGERTFQEWEKRTSI